MTPLRVLLALVPPLVLSGCVHGAYRMGNMTPDPSFAADPPVAASTVTENGGIRVSRNSIYAGRRAARIGDHLTVRIAHNTQADSTANTTAGRESDASLAITAFLGLQNQLPPSLGGVAQVPAEIGAEPSAQIAGKAGSSFTGNGTTNRRGMLEGTLTVQVVDVKPNGILVIGGRQAVKINNEIQVLNLRGEVDPRAVAPDNSIDSGQIVDARIEFSGVGVVAGKQRPGWLVRILDVISPL